MKKVVGTISFVCLIAFGMISQDEKITLESDELYSALSLRSIGPAFTSGRIADIAIHPDDENIWYVAVGSGGVWKTVNGGVTWDPIFDDQPSYSTGCITIDPNNPHTIWLGTGENVGGRHVGFGDGVYKSQDGGASWTHMGLPESQHISEILVHPTNPNVVWVAAQGPLWNKGGERGLYKTMDGGTIWKKVLSGNDWTGVTDIAMDPRDPDLMYAATWQRHRSVAAYMGGGPDSGIHRSTDGGDTWERLSSGIPKSNLGKIGIAISPQQPDVIYAAIELDRTKGGVYKSTNRGSSWNKMSDAVSGATGPHYYQELYASPHAFDRIYLMDVRIQVSDDGGANFRRLKEKDKHSDNHAIVFRADDPDYLLVGTDAGIYESFDLAENWRFIDNLPLTQYYKVAVDDSKPFYKIYGGTQDNGSHGGMSRTNSRQGIRNADWWKTLFSDGHQSATEPGNPNITYAETQQGGLFRIDQLTGEQVSIQPQAGPGEDFERFNWDAPVVVSSHNPQRLYFASQRVWRSENRGDSWIPISPDLTKDQERIALPIMGRVQSWDNPWDVGAMSNYNTITSITESPLNENIIYAGTDDGIIQVTIDGGANWTKTETNRLPGVPATAFVNDIKADLHNEGTAYIALDNHKSGDFKPYLYKTLDYGKTWKSIKGNIPDKHLCWRLVQDHVDPNLLFAATEFSIYFTINGGDHWNKLKGSPTISFRDLAIQKREDDLVGASFGRGFYVLDDYSPLRHMNRELIASEAKIMPIKDAQKFHRRDMAGQQGAAYYTGDNPPYGAIIRYYLKEGFSNELKIRKKKEKDMNENNQNIPFPGWDVLAAETQDMEDKIWLTIRDKQDKLIERLEGKDSKGLNQVSWNLQAVSKNAIGVAGDGGWRGGMEVPYGTYNVTLTKVVDGEVTILAGPESFNVVPLLEPAIPAKPTAEVIAFKQDVDETQQAISAAGMMLKHLQQKAEALRRAMNSADQESPDIIMQLFDLDKELLSIDVLMKGNPAKEEIGERNNPTLQNRLWTAMRGLRSSHGPTETQRQSLAIAQSEFGSVREKLEKVQQDMIPTIESGLKAIGSPWIEGQALPQLSTNK